MAKEVKGRNGGTLKPAQKGEVRNPKGRGKGRLNNSTIMQRWLLDQQLQAVNPATKKSEKMTVLDAITVAMIGQALAGDVRAYTALMDRLEGKPRQSIQVGGDPDGEPIQHEVTPGEVDYDALPDEVLQQIVAARKQQNG